jgi:6-pyruvoyltetrahydropterin/6-carboxytetrahydropterin synthase
MTSLKVYVSRKAHFSAAHRLYHPSLSEAENLALFDKCSNANGHGHNYTVEVTVAGNPDPISGYVIDLKKLKRIIDEHFIQFVDHKNLNTDVPFLQGIIPTAENIVAACWLQIQPHINEGSLYCIRLYETENNFVEYKGE